ncbi:MAG: hypothetical protein K6T90_16835 [Leptolyngbyaceae cyanobacterium HOT.MB2.61]|jgi:hypothetical protein|nr:hypothetical protein [Leptolyngbyaceae cyanobacterium HOT.MB2.61]
MGLNSNYRNGAIASGTGLLTSVAAVGLLWANVTVSSASAARWLICRGSMNNGWRYTAEYYNGSFTEIRWRRAGGRSEVSPLTYSYTNRRGQPVYTGTLMAAVTVTLVDLSYGNVGPGSQISVQVEEWGRSRGTCNYPIRGW